MTSIRKERAMARKRLIYLHCNVERMCLGPGLCMGCISVIMTCLRQLCADLCRSWYIASAGLNLKRLMENFRSSSSHYHK